MVVHAAVGTWTATGNVAAMSSEHLVGGVEAQGEGCPEDRPRVHLSTDPASALSIVGGRKFGAHPFVVALVAVAIGIVAALSGVYGTTSTPGKRHAAPGARPGSQAGSGHSEHALLALPTTIAWSDMHLAFTARFTGTTLNPAQWETCYPWADTTAGCTNFGNRQEIEWYLPSQDVVSGGALHLNAAHIATPGTTMTGGAKTYPYRSGIVTTYSKFDFTYGYVQITARLPAGRELWPAFWMLPTDESSLPEIDIAEGAPTARNMTANLHPTVGPTFSRQIISAAAPGRWQTYGINWEPGALTWYLDGEPLTTDTNTVPTHAMYLIMDLAVTNFVPACLAAQAPASCSGSLDVRSVQVWQRGPLQ